MDYSIKHYANVIGFGKASYSLGYEYGCDRDPCIIPFHGQKRISIPGDIPQKPISFALWLQRVMNYSSYHVQTPEALKSLLANDDIKYFAIGYDERPTEFPPNETVYLIPQKIFEYFNYTNIEKGVYVYRHMDRNLVPFTGNWTYDTQRHYSKFSEDVETGKDYWGFFFYDDSDVESTQTSINIYRQVYSNFSDQIELFFLDTEKGKSVISEGHYKKGTPPFFVLCKASDISDFWAVQNEEISFEGISKLILRVKSGEMFKTSFSQKKIPQPSNIAFRQIVYSEMDKYILNNENDVLLMSTAPWCGHCKEFKPVFNETAKILKNANIPFNIFWFDSTKNDLPSYVPSHSSYPTLYFYPKNNKIAFEYDLLKAHTIQTSLEWIHNHSTVKFDIPDYNLTAHEEEMKKNQEILKNE